MVCQFKSDGFGISRHLIDQSMQEMGLHTYSIPHIGNILCGNGNEHHRCIISFLHVPTITKDPLTQRNRLT